MPQSSPKIERTFSMIKPDAVKKNLIGEIIKRFEAAGLKVCAAKLARPPKTVFEELYREHLGKPFYNTLMAFAQSGPVFPMIVSGEGAVAKVRALIGKTNPYEAGPGTIRGDFFGETSWPESPKTANVIHASDSVASAEREIKIFFSAAEIIR